MSNLAVVEQAQANLARPLSAVEVRAQVNLIQEVMKAVMIDGTHFGKIPGTPKPTLYKAGSEKILATFRIGIEPEVIDLSTADEIRYRVLAHAFLQSTGQRIGTGVGEASTNEERYRWRAAVCPEEWTEAPEDRRRKKWARGQSGPYQTPQIRTNPADLANTVLKMAKKRAQIDVTLTVTGASDVFAQDIEDLPDEVREAVGDAEAPPAKPPIQPPQRKAAAAAPAGPVGEVVEVRIKDLTSKSGQTGDRQWTRWVMLGDNGHRYGTFDAKVAGTLGEAREAGLPVRVTFTAGEKGNTIAAVTIVEREPGSDDV